MVARVFDGGKVKCKNLHGEMMLRALIEWKSLHVLGECGGVMCLEMRFGRTEL